MRAGVPIGDITAGLYAAIAVLAGLEYRRSTGRGQHIDVAMLDSQISLLSYPAQYYFTGGLIATHQGRAHVSVPTYNTFATEDGREIVVAANTQEMWVSLCEVLGCSDLVEDPRFLTGPDRLQHREELLTILRERFVGRRLEDVHAALLEHRVPVAPINPIDVALEDTQVRHREMVVRVPHRSGREYVTLGNPMKPDDALGGVFASPPALGGDTRAVLAGLGYSGEEIEKLLAGGSVKAER